MCGPPHPDTDRICSPLPPRGAKLQEDDAMQTLLRILLDADWSPGPWVWAHLFGLLLGVLSVPSVLLGRRGQPLSALAWILALLSLPYVGLLGWWVLGRRYLRRKRVRHRRAS